MTAPAISVVMSVHNGAPFLAEAISSVLAQTEGDFEFLVLDDGSTDESGAILVDFAARDSRIRVLHQTNQGLVASLNRLIDEARAPLIARMDADDICLPTRFARQRAFLDANPDHGVVGCWTLDISANGAPRPGRATHHPTTHEAFLAAIDEGAPLLCHPATMFRRALILSVGGYRRAYWHCEDYDLWLRLAPVTRLCSLPEPLLKYRYSQAQVSARNIVRQQIGVAAARLAFLARAAGRPDPTEGLAELPPLHSFDILFGTEGAARHARRIVVPGLLHSPVALEGAGFDLVVNHIAEGGKVPGLWRTVARLARWGAYRRAFQLAAVLIASAPRAPDCA
ncbi:MAG: glycosyltransferase [Chakrabartia sp.]